MLNSRLALIGLLFFASCSSHQPKVDEPDNLGLAKQRVKAWLDSEAYPKAVALTYSQVRKDLEALLDERSNVEYAIVFDVDETVLSNKNYYVRTDFGFVRQLFEQWVSEARCEAIPAALEFYRWAKAKKFAAFFVTGRLRRNNDVNKDLTILNLRNVSFNNFEGIYFKPKPVAGEPASVVSFKGESRCDIEHKGFKIAAVIGDQYSDLKGSCLGLKTYKIPNPMYFIPDGGREKQKG